MDESSIPYEVTARKKSDSTLDEKAVKLYLTKVDGTSEEEVLLANYNSLTQTDYVSVSKHTEKTIYNGKVPAGEEDYEQNFRLRMWIDSSIDFSPVKDENGNDTYPYNDKEFTVTVNVYANAKVVTDEDIANESKAEISSLSVDGTELIAVTGGDYDYKVAFPEGTTSTTIDVETQSEYATVSVERLDSLAYQTSSIKKLSTSRTLELTKGNNYFKITVTSEDKEVKNEFILKISVGLNDSILGYVSETRFQNDTVTEISANGTTYSAHVYEFDGDQVWSENKTFGVASDAGTAETNYQNMVIVKVNGDLTIDSGVTVTTYSGSYGGVRGFLLYVTGTLTNNGIISGNSKGAKATDAEDVYLWQNADGSFEYVPKVGADGGGGATAYASAGTGYTVNTPGGAGKPGEGRQTGGGLAGNAISVVSYSGCSYVTFSSAGGKGNSYSGGAPSPTKSCQVTGSRCEASCSGTGGPSTNGGGGGLVIIYSDSIYNTGTITSTGPSGYGGGSINVFYNENYTSTGKYVVTGSGAGTYTIGSIATKTFVQYNE